MSRNDTSIGIYNFPQTVAVTTETALLAPTASGVYPGLPSPVIPLSTSTYPAGVFIGVPADVAGGEFDGHPFEVVLAAKVTTSATANLTVNLYNAKASTFAGGPAASTYTLATLGSGCTDVAPGSATAVGTGGASINVLVRATFLWDSTSKTLSTLTVTQYQKGASVSTTPANATTVAQGDLNFIPSFTVSAGTATITVTEFVINRL